MDSRLEQLQEVLSAAVEGMSSEQLSWHPAGKWCAAEILEHLYLTYTGTIKGFERAVQEGKPLGTHLSLRHRARIIAVTGFGYLPEGRQAPKMAQPRGLPKEKVRDELRLKIVAMDAIVAQCEQRFGRRVKLLDHPILGPLTAGQWKKFHLVHGLHHVKQIRRLREAATRLG